MLKAIVKVIGYVDGERTEFLPGDEVKGLSEHDRKELIAAGAIEDTAQAAKEDKAKALGEEAALRDFEEAKKKVQAAQESIAPQGQKPAAKAGKK